MDISVYGFVLDAKNAANLATFYSKLLNEEIVVSNEEWAAIKTKGGLYIAFQTIENYQSPSWPWSENQQHPMAHIDFVVDDIDKAVEHAIQCGATKATIQYSDSHVVMLDPDQHPFCLALNE